MLRPVSVTRDAAATRMMSLVLCGLSKNSVRIPELDTHSPEDGQSESKHAITLIQSFGRAADRAFASPKVGTMRMEPVSSQGWSQSNSGNFSGPVWICRLSDPDKPEGVTVLGVHFLPGSRTDWHSHSEGQVLYVTAGRGVVATEGGDRAEIDPGDTITTPAGELHWHGAAPDSPMTHLSITSGAGASWAGAKVTDAEYTG